MWPDSPDVARLHTQAAHAPPPLSGGVGPVATTASRSRHPQPSIPPAGTRTTPVAFCCSGVRPSISGQAPKQVRSRKGEIGMDQVEGRHPGRSRRARSGAAPVAPGRYAPGDAARSAPADPVWRARESAWQVPANTAWRGSSETAWRAEARLGRSPYVQEAPDASGAQVRTPRCAGSPTKGHSLAADGPEFAPDPAWAPRRRPGLQIGTRRYGPY